MLTMDIVNEILFAGKAQEKTAPIIGANTVEQLQESLGAVAVQLSGEEMAALHEVSAWKDQ